MKTKNKLYDIFTFTSVTFLPAMTNINMSYSGQSSFRVTPVFPNENIHAHSGEVLTADHPKRFLPKRISPTCESSDEPSGVMDVREVSAALSKDRKTG